MENYSQYALVQVHDDMGYFKQLMNKYISEGWKPIGGVSVTSVVSDTTGYPSPTGNEITIYYTQAVVK